MALATCTAARTVVFFINETISTTRSTHTIRVTVKNRRKTQHIHRKTLTSQNCNLERFPPRKQLDQCDRSMNSAVIEMFRFFDSWFLFRHDTYAVLLESGTLPTVDDGLDKTSSERRNLS